MNIEHVRQAMLQKHAFDWGSAGKATGDFFKRLATAKVMPNLSLGTRVGIGAGFAGGLMAPKALKYVANKADQAGVDLGEWYFEEDNEKEKARQEALDRQIERSNRLLAQREELNARKATDAVTQKQIAEQKANLALAQESAEAERAKALSMQNEAASLQQAAEERAKGFDKELNKERAMAAQKQEQLARRIQQQGDVNRMLGVGLGAGAGGLAGYGIGAALTDKPVYRILAALAGAGAGGYGTNYLMSKLNKDKLYSTLAGKQASVATPADVAPAVPGASAFGNARAWLKKRKALKEPVSAHKAVATQPDNNQVKSASAEQLPLAHRVLLSLAVNGMPRPE